MERAINEHADINGLVIESPVDFLSLTDSDFTTRRFHSQDHHCVDLIHRIQRRDLPFVAVEISGRSMAEDARASKLWNLRLSKDLWKNHDKVAEGRRIASWIVSATAVSDESDVWVDFPYMVKLSTLPLTDGTSLEATYASFPGETWADQYVKYLYKGMVHGPAGSLNEVADAFIGIASDVYDTDFNPTARQSLSLSRRP